MPITITRLLNNQLSQQINKSLNDHNAMRNSLLAAVKSIQRERYEREYFNPDSIQAVFSAGAQLVSDLYCSNSIDEIVKALSIYKTNINCLTDVSLDDDTQAFLDQTSGIPGVKTTVNFQDDRKYEGQFQNGQWHSYGTYTLPTGEKYEGPFQNGHAHGHGVLTWPDGRKYEGGFHNGLRHGYATYILSEGQKYEGQFQNGHAQGRGVLTWPDGRKYEGQFQNGHVHGQGVLTWPDGQKYDGEFQNDQWEGPGVLTLQDGIKYKGVFTDNLAYNITIIWPNGNTEQSNITLVGPSLIK